MSTACAHAAGESKAQSLWRVKNYLGDCFRRWKARLGTPKAITDMARKPARILWYLIKHQTPYDPSCGSTPRKH